MWTALLGVQLLLPAVPYFCSVKQSQSLPAGLQHGGQCSCWRQLDSSLQPKVLRSGCITHSVGKGDAELQVLQLDNRLLLALKLLPQQSNSVAAH